MSVTTEWQQVRAAARRGNRMLRLRRELRKLDDAALLKRLGKYLGRTPSEVRTRYRTWSHAGIERDRVIDAIVRYEVPE